ncbi:hypothetical protein ACE10Z_34960 [Bradyrhizobium sp. Pha-3]|uniref:hypothetical protein n=1 Tax=Bradyrhizobium sp. Pha-3 TaxID=208375 RepID=UPI0035D46CFC
MFEPDAATVQPGILALGLRAHAQKLGVAIYEHSPMIRLERTRTPKVVTRKRLGLKQKGRSGHERLGSPVSLSPAQGGDLVERLDRDEGQARQVERDRFYKGHCDMRFPHVSLNYYRNTPDGRIVQAVTMECHLEIDTWFESFSGQSSTEVIKRVHNRPTARAGALRARSCASQIARYAPSIVFLPTS